MKYCGKCDTTKLFKEFYVCAKNKDGRYYICKKCTKKSTENYNNISYEEGKLIYIKEPVNHSYNTNFKQAQTEEITGIIEKIDGNWYTILPSRV